MNKKSDADVNIAGPSKASNISSTEDTSSSDSTFVAPAAKKGKRQAFREAWLQNPSFKSWLKQADDPHKAKCTACSKLLKAKKSQLDEHAKSDGHIMNLQQNAGASISIRSDAATSSSDTQNNSSSDSTFVAPVAKKGKRQVFREAWLQNPSFKSWLKQADEPHKAKCTVCSKLLRAHKCHLDEHAKSDCHIMNLQQNVGASISVCSDAATSSSDTENNSSADVSIAGPSSAAFLISVGDSDSSSDSTFVAPAAKKGKRQAFREAWLQNPSLKSWLKQADDPHKAKCTACSKLLTAHKSYLEKHAKSDIHIMNMIYHTKLGTSATKKTFADEVKEAEITMCMNAIEHDISFRSYSNFVKMVKKVLTNPNVLPYLSTERTKMTAIAKKVVNKSVIVEQVLGTSRADESNE